jgi:hypothetical protein
MNIFVIDRDPKIAARHLVDLHCPKMVTESVQILSNCFSINDLSSQDCPKTQAGTSRKHSYPHHPCCKWVKQSRANMKWVIKHAKELDQERMARFNSTTPHFSIAFILWCEANIDKSLAPDVPLTSFAQAMPDEFKNDDAVVAYKNYYKFGKVHLHKWTRNKPDWIN